MMEVSVCAGIAGVMIVVASQAADACYSVCSWLVGG